MFCPDCNYNMFKENNTEVTCTHCGLVVENQVLDNNIYESYDQSIYKKETDIGELISKYGLSDQCEDYIQSIYTKIKQYLTNINKEYAMHISISIGFEIDNTYVFDHCPKYKRMRNRALELFQEPYKNRNKNTPKRKTWAHNIKLFHKIMNQNKSITDIKACYELYEKLPYDNKDLKNIKEHSIFLTIVFINAKSINPNLKTIDFAKQNEISTTTILKTQKLILSLIT